MTMKSVSGCICTLVTATAMLLSAGGWVSPDVAPSGVPDCNTNGLDDTTEIGQSSASTFMWTGGALVIPDNYTLNQIPLLATINASKSGLITDVNVAVDIEITDTRDIDMYLVHNGITAELCTDVGVTGADDNFTGTVFDDDVANSISTADAPFTGSFQTEGGQLFFYDGLDQAGAWTLRIEDDLSSDTGTLLSWSVIVSATNNDCNTNGILDACEVGDDCNTNSVPDVCELDQDCNNDGMIDACVPGDDCNANGIPDSCELGTNDCNGNGLPDECDVAGSTSDDCDMNGQPDECQLDSSVRVFSNNTSMEIPDVSAPIESSITVTSVGVITDVNIQFSIQHTEDDDIDMFLAHDGVISEMFSDIGVTGDNFTNTILDDEAATGMPDSSGSAPFTGTFRPEGSLAVFDGLNKNGVWTLYVRDDLATDTGTLLNWSLMIANANDDCNNNGIIDACEIGGDCNTNGIPDECDEGGCNTNGIPDECELVTDCNTNGLPDVCDLLGEVNLDSGAISPFFGDGSGSPAAFVINGAFPTNGDVTITTTWECDCGLESGTTEQYNIDINGILVGTGGAIGGETNCQTGLEVFVVSAADWNNAVLIGAGTVTVTATANTGVNNASCTSSFMQFNVVYGSGGDCNTNGTPDSCDTDDGGSDDCNTNDIPDECEVDCNTNGTPDDCDGSPDCNTNDIPDECDVVGSTAGPVSADCNNNVIPDECEADCNANGTPDDCDISAGTSGDVNNNDVPDDCEDCNNNGTVDFNDIANGSSTDCNTNGEPDECELGGIQIESSSPMLEINNTLPPAVDTITLADVFAPVLDVNVEVNIQHTFDDDMDVFIDHNGVTVELFTDIGVGGDNFTGTILDDEAVSTLPDVSTSAPFTGSFQPEGLLADFDGLPANGDWTISVTDDATGDTGTLLSWSLILDVPGADCNTNGVVDACDIDTESSLDCDNNDIPDECDADCNGNGIPDGCDLIAMTSPDCNTNAVLDDCELGANDCNENGVPDACDIAGPTSDDCNTNDLPDACEVGSADRAETLVVNESIPDAGNLLSTISVTSVGEIADVDLEINVQHTNDTDLDIFLIHDNVTLEIATDRGGTGDNFTGTIFDDEASEIIPTATTDAPFTGRYRPEFALSAFDGLNKYGDWTLSVTDDLTNNTGTLLSWSLYITNVTADCNTDGIVDECAMFDDCNTNAVPDECEDDIDCDTNNVPDECEVVANDCNTNGIVDACDDNVDCNTNDIPEECEVFDDCNTNAYPDECDALGVNEFNSGGIMPFYGDTGGSPAVFTITNAPEALGDVELVVDWVCDCGSTGEDFDIDVNGLFIGTGGGFGGAANCDSGQNVFVISQMDWNDARSIGGGDVTITAVAATSVNNTSCDGTSGDDGTSEIIYTVTYAGGGDCNTNGVPDECDVANGATDINNNDIPDICEDCNNNGTPDILEPGFVDCNTNGLLDECDITDMLSTDCNTNDVPDECDTDCNTNGLADVCEIADMLLDDCNGDGVPNLCEADCNNNGQPDGCDISSGSALDCNTNSIPDACELFAGGVFNSGVLMPFSDAALNVQYVIPSAPLAAEDVTIELVRNADMDGSGENYDLDLNGLVIAMDVFGGGQCTEQTDVFIVSAVDWNTALGMGGGNMTITATPDLSVDAVTCEGTAEITVTLVGLGEDCNENGLVDACEIADMVSPDCNTNDIPDDCEPGGTGDCNTNGIPDACDEFNDCNTNGVPDVCDTIGGAGDCDGNAVPDNCEFVDCNGNGVLDTCDVLGGTSGDCNTDSVPDDCQLVIGGVFNSGVLTPFSDAALNVQFVIPGAPVTNDDVTIEIVRNADMDGSGENYDLDLNGLVIAMNVFGGGQCTEQTDVFVVSAVDWNSALSLGGGTMTITATPDLSVDAVTCEGTADITVTLIGQGEDCNQNGLVDSCEIADMVSPDCNTNDIPDSCENGGAGDCNTNGIVDACDPALVDCNTNGLIDECDVGGGTSADCDGNIVPDECEFVDCNNNGLYDACDIIGATSGDCNDNDVPDECELDCNTNGVADECDIDTMASDDCDMNGQPDECQLVDLPKAFTTAPNAEIPDNGDVNPEMVLLSDINVPSSAIVADVNVEVNISHTENDDLDVYLFHDGVRVELFTDIGVTGDNFTGTILDDEAANPLLDSSSAAPFTGVFQPEGDLSAFDGTNKQGIWTLNVMDDLTGDTGTLLSWSLYITNAPDDCNTNGVLDGCEVGGDCDTNGVPDVCQTDDCNTNGIPDGCDLATDCNTNGVPDECDAEALNVMFSSGIQRPFDEFNSQSLTINNAPNASDLVVIDVRAASDLSLGTEIASVLVNGQVVGSIFTATSTDCDEVFDFVNVSPTFWNDEVALSGGTMLIEVVADPLVDVGSCSASFVDIKVTVPFVADGNGNGIPDECDTGGGCATCAGDMTGDGFVDGDDVQCFVECLISGSTASCSNCDCADMDGANGVDAADLALFVTRLLSGSTACP